MKTWPSGTSGGKRGPPARPRRSFDRKEPCHDAHPRRPPLPRRHRSRRSLAPRVRPTSPRSPAPHAPGLEIVGAGHRVPLADGSPRRVREPRPRRLRAVAAGRQGRRRRRRSTSTPPCTAAPASTPSSAPRCTRAPASPSAPSSAAAPTTRSSSPATPPTPSTCSPTASRPTPPSSSSRPSTTRRCCPGKSTPSSGCPPRPPPRPPSAPSATPAATPAKTGPVLVVVTGASNVTGEIWPIARLAAVAHAHGARIALDAAQLAPHRPFSITDLWVDYVAISGHKVYAPYGAGALIGRADWLADAPPYLVGGGATSTVEDDRTVWKPLPDRHEAGTPNIPGVVALASACHALRTADRDAPRHR